LKESKPRLKIHYHGISCFASSIRLSLQLSFCADPSWRIHVIGQLEPNLTSIHALLPNCCPNAFASIAIVAPGFGGVAQR
jgi:hypothetical protein